MANKFKVTGYVDSYSTGSLIQALKSPTTLGDVEIEVDSPGGYVTAGVRAFNAMRDYKNGKINVKMGAMAASAAAFFPMAADTIEVRDNTMFMIHNAWVFMAGDARDLEREAGVLRSMDKVIAKAISKKSGKDVSEVATLMDAETYLFGAEITDAGFADVLVDTDEADATDKETALNLTKQEVKEAKNHVMKDPINMSELTACLNAMREEGGNPAEENSSENLETNNPNRPKPSDAGDNEGATSVSITKEDLDKARNEGREEGKKELQNSVACHLANYDRDPDGVIKNIKEGVPFDTLTQAEYLNAKPKKEELNSREEENAGKIDPPEEAQAENAKAKNSLAAMNDLCVARGVDNG
jgi:ATP-dependent protease ClpP protease subunit